MSISLSTFDSRRCTARNTAHSDYHIPRVGFFRAPISCVTEPCENLLRAEKALAGGQDDSLDLFRGRVTNSPASVSRPKLAFGLKRASANITPKPLFSLVTRASFPGNVPVVDLATQPTSGSTRDNGEKWRSEGSPRMAW